jgi:hypothetical protein
LNYTRQWNSRVASNPPWSRSQLGRPGLAFVPLRHATGMTVWPNPLNYTRQWNSRVALF